MACRLPVPNHYLNQLNWFRWQYCSYEIAGAYIVIYLSFIFSFAYSILFHLFIHLSILFHLFIHLSIYLFISSFVTKRDALFPPALTTPVQYGGWSVYYIRPSGYLVRPSASIELTATYIWLWMSAQPLTHWGWDKMDAISQTTTSNAFSWMKMFEFRLNFHWSLFLRVQLTIFQHWFR